MSLFHFSKINENLGNKEKDPIYRTEQIQENELYKTQQNFKEPQETNKSNTFQNPCLQASVKNTKSFAKPAMRKGHHKVNQIRNNKEMAQAYERLKSGIKETDIDNENSLLLNLKEHEVLDRKEDFKEVEKQTQNTTGDFQESWLQASVKNTKSFAKPAMRKGHHKIEQARDAELQEKDEQLVSAWERDDPGLKDYFNRYRFYQLFYSQADSCAVEFIKNMKEDSFCDLINDLFINRYGYNNINKVEKLLNSMSIEIKVGYVKRFHKVASHVKTRIMRNWSNNFFINALIMQRNMKRKGAY